MSNIIHEKGVPLQEWANAHEPEKKMLWEPAYWRQIIFVRDQIHRLCVVTFEESLKNPVMVVGTHTSKSILLPVYSIKIPGLEIRMRDNFYDWKVSIQSEVPLHDNFHGVVRKAEKLHPVYFEGFQGEWVFGSYNQNPRQFSVEIQNDYDLYAFILIVTDALRQK